MSEKQIKDITVKDLTEHADLNRGTFYLHYLDIYDLLNQLEDEVIENVSMMIQDFNFRNSNQSTYLLLEQLFEYIYDNKHILKTFLQSHSQGHFFNKIQLLIKTIGLDTLKNLYQESDSIEYTLFLSFVSNGVIGVTEQWISDGMTLTPKEMALLIDNIINHGAKILIQK